MNRSDLEIQKELKKLQEYWFSGTLSDKNKRWFKKNDQYINNNFGQLLRDVEKKIVDNWFDEDCNEESQDFSEKTVESASNLNQSNLNQRLQSIDFLNRLSYLETLGLVILLDQVTRCVERDLKRNLEGDLEKIRERKIKNTMIACDIARDYLEGYDPVWDVHSPEDYLDEYVVFALMPFKHYNILDNFTVIKSEIERFGGFSRDEDTLLRFYKDCLVKYSSKKNLECWMDGPKQTQTTKRSFSTTQYFFIFVNLLMLILSFYHRVYRIIFITIFGLIVNYDFFFKPMDLSPYFGNITEQLPNGFFHLKDRFDDYSDFRFERTLEGDYRIVECVADFLKSIEIPEIVDPTLEKFRKTTLTVSLSGGLSSMVLTFILRYLMMFYSFNLQAIYITYNNSKREEKFVRWYCKMLNIPIYVRRVKEIKREDCDKLSRNFYEDLTKNIRFSMYALMNGPIILDHTHDDVIANIWSNFAKGQHIFDLKKMSVISNRSFNMKNNKYNIPLLRPFLNVKKDEIVQFAEENSIAYLKKSARSSNCRNTFLSATNNLFGDSNVEYVADTLSNVKALVDNHINVFYSRFDCVYVNERESERESDRESSTCVGFKIELNELDLKCGLYIWQNIFGNFFKFLSLSRDDVDIDRYYLPSKNSVNNFLESLCRNYDEEKSVCIQFDNKLYVYLKHSKNRKILYMIDRQEMSRYLNVDERSLSKEHFKELINNDCSKIEKTKL